MHDKQSPPGTCADGDQKEGWSERDLNPRQFLDREPQCNEEVAYASCLNPAP